MDKQVDEEMASTADELIRKIARKIKIANLLINQPTGDRSTEQKPTSGQQMPNGRQTPTKLQWPARGRKLTYFALFIAFIRF